MGKENAAHLPLASSRAQTARWAAVRGGAASGGVGGRVDPSPAVRGAGTGRPAARCFSESGSESNPLASTHLLPTQSITEHGRDLWPE